MTTANLPKLQDKLNRRRMTAYPRTRLAEDLTAAELHKLQTVAEAGVQSDNNGCLSVLAGVLVALLAVLL